MQTHHGSSSSLAPTDTSPGLAEIQQEWRQILTPWWKATLAILPTFLMTRLLFFLLTYFGSVLFTITGGSSFALTFKSVLYGWYHWDTTRYLTIATQGYLSQDYTGFFPLYPTIVHALSALTHQDVLLIGMLISNLAFLGALIVFFRLMEKEFDYATATRSVLYLSIFPTALLFFAAYDVSLLLFCVLFCFYALRQNAWWLAGLFGGLAALTHATGIFLFIVFLYEFSRQHVTSLQQAWRERRIQAFTPFLSPLLAALCIPLGLFIYMYTLSRKFRDALAFLHPGEGSHASAPWTAPLTTIQNIFKDPFYSFTTTHSLFEFSLFVCVCAMLVLCFVGPAKLDKNQWAFPLFGLLILIYSLFYPYLPAALISQFDPFPAIQYTTLIIFSTFIILARLGKAAWFNQTVLLLSLPMLAFLVFQLLKGYWALS